MAETKIVGIAGAGSGVGTTHLCISVAAKLNMEGYKVAVYEANNFRAFAELANNADVRIRNNAYVYEGITFFLKEQELALVKKSFDYIICDYGNYKTANKTMFNTSSICIIVASSRLWNFSKIIDNLPGIEDDDIYGNYKFVFPFAENRKIQKLIKASITCTDDVIFTGYNADPFMPDNLSLESLLGIKTEKESKKFGLFKKKDKFEEAEKDDDDDDDEEDVEYEEPAHLEGLPMSEVKETVEEALYGTPAPQIRNNSYASGGYHNSRLDPRPEVPQSKPQPQEPKITEEYPASEPVRTYEKPVTESRSVPVPEPARSVDAEMLKNAKEMMNFIERSTQFDWSEKLVVKDKLITLTQKEKAALNEVKA